MKTAAWCAGVALTTAAGLSGCSYLGGSGTAPATAALACGQLDITVNYRGDGATLAVGDEQYSLVQVPAASGAKYQGDEDPEIQLWNKGNVTMLSVGNRSWPQCVPQGSIAEPFTARGNEPFWHVAVDGGQLSLKRMGADEVGPAGYEVASSNVTGQTLKATLNGQTVVLETAPQLCRDTMSGMAYPHQARLSIDGEKLAGCAGDPALLLQGVEWVVEDIDNGGIIDRSRVTINFLPENRVAGRASCNGFMGGYQLTGEGLTFGQAATTMMACAPALMNQERKFLEVLGNVQRFDISRTGALILQTGDGRTLRAYGAQSLTP